jgi:hypothetical protein
MIVRFLLGIPHACGFEVLDTELDGASVNFERLNSSRSHTVAITWQQHPDLLKIKNLHVDFLVYSMKQLYG